MLKVVDVEFEVDGDLFVYIGSGKLSIMLDDVVYLYINDENGNEIRFRFKDINAALAFREEFNAAFEENKDFIERKKSLLKEKSEVK